MELALCFKSIVTAICGNVTVGNVNFTVYGNQERKIGGNSSLNENFSRISGFIVPDEFHTFEMEKCVACQ